LSLTDPALVGLVLDMGHYMFGGGDPLEALKNIRRGYGIYISRIAIRKRPKYQGKRLGLL